jgi:HEAT repeat protein
MKIIVTLFFVSVLAAQQPQIENAKLQTRAVAGSLATEFSQMGAGPYWAAWSEPIIPGQHNEVCSWNRGNYQESARTIGAPLRLEGETALVVLVRIENSQVSELRVSSPDCHLDAGGTSFYWLTNVSPAESIAWLKAQVGRQRSDSAIMMIALHQNAAADQALDELSATTQPLEMRKRVASWLGNSRGAHGVATLKRMLSDPNSEVRDRVVSALAQSKDPQGITLVIDAARNDKDPHVRGQALMSLAQRAATQVSREAIQNAIANDPEQSVKERAVSALAQMPNSEGVPMLIDIAKSHKDANVRKKAMQQLGQSKDPRALDFFAQVLKP